MPGDEWKDKDVALLLHVWSDMNVQDNSSLVAEEDKSFDRTAQQVKVKHKGLKWIHTIYFSSSLYIINQKHVNSFSLYNHMGCTLFWVKFGHAFAYFVVSCSLTRWRYYSI